MFKYRPSNGCGIIDFRTNVYSLGCILHVCLNGRLPVYQLNPIYSRPNISGLRTQTP
jgi:serine/threonine protein kinase